MFPSCTLRVRLAAPLTVRDPTNGVSDRSEDALVCLGGITGEYDDDAFSRLP